MYPGCPDTSAVVRSPQRWRAWRRAELGRYKGPVAVQKQELRIGERRAWPARVRVVLVGRQDRETKKAGGVKKWSRETTLPEENNRFESSSYHDDAGI